MKIELNQTFEGQDGKNIPYDETRDMTLKDVICQSLTTSTKADETMPGKEKADRWDLYLKVKHAEDYIDLPVEDVSKIKDLIGRLFVIPIVGQSWKMLN